MREIQLIILLLLFYGYGISQTKKYTQGNVTYTFGIASSYSKPIEKEKELPEHIRSEAKKITKQTSLNNLKFKSGFINNLESFFKENPNSKNFGRQYPAYILLYEWKELSLGIMQYEIFMAFDSYGQLIGINFPRNYFQEKYDFNSLDFAFQKADSLINLDSKRYDEPSVNLMFITSENDLVWTFEYNASKEKTTKKVSVNFTSRKYKVEQLDIIEFNFSEDIKLEEEILELKNNKP